MPVPESDRQESNQRRRSRISRSVMCASAPQPSFNWNPIDSKLNISVWPFKKQHKREERRQRTDKKGGKRRRISSPPLVSSRIFGSNVLSRRDTQGPLPPYERGLFNPAAEWRLIRKSVGTQAYGLMKICAD